MAFIETTSASDVAGDARAMYARQQSHYGYVPDYAKVFCHRPEIMELWARLLAGIKRPMGQRRFELATWAAAQALRSTLCSVAHGRALLQFFSAEDVRAMARGEVPASLTPAEAALMDFSRKVARDATTVTADDVQGLKRHGFDDGEIFDIAAAAAGRAFFTKVIESLGVRSDSTLQSMDPALRSALAVGKPIEFVDPEVLADETLAAAG
jgi:uncharacterized peroxidase-related enzyme